MNTINLLGNLTCEPKAKEYQQGKAVCKFRIAVKRPFSKDVTDFFNVTAFGKTAETINQYFHKGDFIAVTGSMQMNTYEDKNGVSRLSPEVIVDRFSFAGSTQRAGKPKQENKAMNIDDEFFLIDDNDPLPF